MYNKDEMETWIAKHFEILARPLTDEKDELLNKPVTSAVRASVKSHLENITAAQNNLLDVLHEDDNLGDYAHHYDRHYVEYNSSWQNYDRSEHLITIATNGVDNYINEKIFEINRATYKKELEVISKKLVLINNEKERLINWLNGIGYNSKMSDGNKQKAYDLLVEAGVDPTVMVRKFKYELSLTGIATEVTKGVLEVETKADKIKKIKALDNK